jgi:DNA primase
MFEPIFTKRDIAERYHRFLPDEIRQYLNRRGIPDGIINRQLLGWNGRRITIPIFGRSGDVITFRFAKSPNDTSESPKMLSEVGSDVEIYGWETLERKPLRVVICEGEFDRLVLEAKGFPAVTSTAGAGTFPDRWGSAFKEIRHIYVCFDRDEAGRRGAENVRRLLPDARIVELPADVGEGGDITDYFVRLGKSRVDFEILLAIAAGKEEALPAARSQLSGERPKKKAVARRAARLKKAISIDRIVSLYAELRPSGQHLVGKCPFHEEHDPSFTVYTDTGTYYCFGCGAHGDLVAFLMQKESVTFGQALDALEAYLYTDELFPTS